MDTYEEDMKLIKCMRFWAVIGLIAAGWLIVHHHDIPVVG